MESELRQIASQLEALKRVPETCVELQWQMTDVQALLRTVTACLSSQTQILERLERTPVDAVALEPSEDPPLLHLVPEHEMAPARSISFPRKKDAKTAQSMEDSAKAKRQRALSMEAIEAHTTQALLMPKKGSNSRSHSQPSSRGVSDFGEDLRPEPPLGSPLGSPSKVVARTEGQRVLQMCRRMSLDDLRINHDAVLAVNGDTTRLHRQDSERQDPFPKLVKVWLVSMGIWDLASIKAVKVLVAISIILLGFFGVVSWLSWVGHSDPYISATTLCYLLGVVAAAWRLRYSGLQKVLTHEDGGLETYARSSGFLDDWRQVSRRRLQEVLVFLVVMLSCRWLAFASERLWDMETSLDSVETASCFSFTALIFGAIVYLQLHIVAGMELAIDSFSVNFYREMDMELALQEWNTVQATLRTLSTKLSTSMLLLGSSCAASLLLLVQLTVLSDGSQIKAGLPFFCFTSWLFPPVLLFLYALMRAASVTEKASRVAPLVNSWTFDDELEGPAWMDMGRQYIVQYMIQSEAGFYLQGMRLHVFQVTKLCYYFAAFIFALFSRSWA